MTAGDSLLALQQRLAGEILAKDTPPQHISTQSHEARAGLALFDLILGPDHIDRATETITFTSTVDAERRFEVDIATNRLSEPRRDDARTVDELIGGWTTSPHQDETLWLPVLTLPRPVPTPVRAVDTTGTEIARPPQRLIRRMLLRAVLHVFAEELTDSARRLQRMRDIGIAPSGDDEARSAHLLLRSNDEARWIAYHAITDACSDSPRAAKSRSRGHTYRTQLPSPTAPESPLRSAADAISARRRSGLDDSKVLALRSLQQALQDTPALGQLMELVHTRYVVVVGLQPRERYRTLAIRLPDASAAREPTDPRSSLSSLRTLWPGNQNYTAFLRVDVPKRIAQYRLEVAGPPDATGAPEVSVSMLSNLVFDPERGRAHRQAVLAARPLLDTSDQTARSRLASSMAYRGLIVLADLLERRRATTQGLADQWRDGVDDDIALLLDERAESLGRQHQRVAAIRDEARQLAADPGSGLLSPRTLHAAIATEWPERSDAPSEDEPLDPASEVNLLGTGVVSGHVGRVRVSRHHFGDSDADPARLELLVGLSADQPSYGGRRIVATVAVTVAVWVLGWLMFDQPLWMFWVNWSEAVGDDVLAGKVEAVVAVLLLVPGFTLTLLRFPTRTSLPGRLHYAGRFQVYAISAVLAGWAGVIAAVGASTTTRHQVAWSAGVGQIAFWLALVSAIWVSLAWRWHQSTHRRLKGADMFLDGRPCSVDGYFDLTVEHR